MARSGRRSGIPPGPPHRPHRPPGPQRRRRTRPAGPAPRRPYHGTGERGRERVDARVEPGASRAKRFWERFGEEKAHVVEYLGLFGFFFPLRKYKRNVSLLCSSPPSPGRSERAQRPMAALPKLHFPSSPRGGAWGGEWLVRAAGRAGCRRWRRRWERACSPAALLLLRASPRAAPERGAPVRKRGCRPGGAAGTAPCRELPPPAQVSHRRAPAASSRCTGISVRLCVCVRLSVCPSVSRAGCSAVCAAQGLCEGE